MWLLLAFIAVPLIEIALFIEIGGWIGLWPTLAIVLLTAVIGSALVRSQGLAVLGQVQRSLDQMRNPTEPLVHGAMILFAGALLLTPGFFTDAVGFSLLVPSVRTWMFGKIRSRVRVHTAGGGPRPGDPFSEDPSARPARHDVIDGDYEEIDPDSVPPRPTHRPSGWTRH